MHVGFADYCIIEVVFECSNVAEYSTLVVQKMINFLIYSDMGDFSLLDSHSNIMRCLMYIKRKELNEAGEGTSVAVMFVTMRIDLLMFHNTKCEASECMSSTCAVRENISESQSD